MLFILRLARLLVVALPITWLFLPGCTHAPKKPVSNAKCKKGELLYDISCHKTEKYCYVFLHNKNDVLAVMKNPGVHGVYTMCAPPIPKTSHSET